MNNTVTDATGIDAVIKIIQTQLYSELLSLWDLSEDDLNGFGRVYKNLRNYTKIPEVFVSKENDYEDPFYDDNSSANFFFLENDNTTTDDQYVFQNKTKVVFALNLDDCYDGTDRLDAKAQRDVIRILRELPISGKYSISGFETGLDNIFTGFSISRIKNDDLHPVHLFAVLIDLNYKLTDKCT